MNFIRTFLLATALTLLATAPPAWAQMAGTLDPNFNPNVSGYIYASAVQPDGKVIIGGQFTTVSEPVHTNVARINGDGSFDASFTASTDNFVYSVAVQPDGNILLGGAFSKVNGSDTLKYLARLKPDGSVDPTFNAANCPNGNVGKMALEADGKIVIAGSFSAPRHTIARLNKDASLDTSFNPGTGATSILSVALQVDGKIVLGGGFTTFNGTPRNRIARLKTNGEVDGSFNPPSGADNTVYCVAVQGDGKIVLGGAFTKVSDTPCQHIARLDSEGGVETTATFHPGSGVAKEVLNVALQTNGKIVIGGYLPLRLNADGSVDTSFHPPSVENQAAYVALQADGKIVLSGSITQVDGAPRNRVARLFNDAATQTLTVPDSTQVRWDRSGAGPDVSQVAFEESTDGGATWKLLGIGTRIPNTSNWQLTGLSIHGGLVRAHGHTAGGFGGCGSGLVQQVVTPLERLQDGNLRFVDEKPTHPDQSLQRRIEVAKGQHPFAIIVGCADSRVPPEIVFDHGLGDVFPIRIAGEVLDNSSLGSIEYAVQHLHVGLIVVLGHEKCGAVDAAVTYDPNAPVDPHDPVPDHVMYLINAILPAVVHGDNDAQTLELSVKENARQVAVKIRNDLDQQHLDEHKTVSIVTGYYNLDKGNVIFYQ